jgi:hypothetical protein
MSRHAPERPPVRIGQTLDYDGLLAKAVEAVEASGLSQKEVAERLSKTRGAVNFALRISGGRYASLQREIIAELTGEVFEPVEQIVTFRLARKADPASSARS